MEVESCEDEDLRRSREIVNINNNQEQSESNDNHIFRHIIWKLDKRFIPFLFLLEFSSYMNRINIGAFYFILF